MKKIIGVLVLFLAASSFVMAQSVTAEWVQVNGKPNLKFTNKTNEGQSVQYTVAGDKPASIDIPANTEVTLPYAGTNPNAKIDPPATKPAAKPKALPKGATSVSLGGTAAPAPAATTAPATTPAPATTTPAQAPAKAPAKK